MATEIGRLVAVFDADTKKLDAGLRSVESKLGGVTKDINKVTDSTKGLTSATAPANAQIAGLGASLGAAAGVAVAAAAAIGGLAAGVAFAGKAIFDLSRHAMELGGHLHDLSQQTNFSVETLNALGNAAETSGGSLDSIAASLGIFQKHLEKANSEGVNAEDILKAWNVSLKDNELALEQVLLKLAAMEAGTTQTAYALELFGRGGKQMLAIMKETGGDLDEFKRRVADAGLEISGAFAASMDEASDNFTRLGQHARILSAEIGEQFVPQINQAVLELTNFLKDNRAEIIRWADALAAATDDIFKWRDAITGSAYATSFWGGLMTDMVNSTNTANTALTILYRGIIAVRNAMAGPFGGVTGGAGPGGAQAGVGVGAPGFLSTVRARGAGGGGGGGGRGGGGGKDQGVTLLQQLQKEFFNLTKHTRLEEIQNQLLEKQYAKTADQMKKNIMVMAIEIDLFKQAQADFDSMVKLVQQLGEAGEKGFVRARRAGEPLLQDLQKMLELSQQMAEGLTRPRTQGTRTRPRRVGEGSDLVDLGGGSFFGEGVGGNRERFVTDAEISRRRAMEELRERMHDLASDITYTLDNAIYEGFRGGAKRGLATLALGFLDMIHQVILGQLKNAIAEALTSGAGSGGGWLSKILGIVIGGVAGGVGGGGKVGGTDLGGSIKLPGFSGFRAAGGPVSANRPYIVGERGPELFIPGSNGKISPNAGTTVNNINVTWEQKGMQTFRQNRSKREMAERIAGLLAT